MNRHTDLIQKWRSLTRTLALDKAEAVGPQLIALYSEPHRRFHTTEHLWQVLRHLDSVGADPLLSMAAWFHDAVYDPGAPDNEERSAQLASRMLVELGLDVEAVCFVADAIRATASHRHDREEFTLLLDADMSILGAAPDAYAAYRISIRDEYRTIADEAFRYGRKAFAVDLLARPAIFRSTYFHLRLEEQARRNLRDELDILETS